MPVFSPVFSKLQSGPFMSGGITLGQRIRALFAHSEQGLWYDPSDFATLFQDAAGTTPVTAVEQPVGKILDKSGRGNHASQATSTKRPILQQDASGRYYLLFDGVDDALSTGSIDFTGTDKMTVVAGVRKLSDAAIGVLVEASSAYFSNAGSFVLLAPQATTNPGYSFSSRGTGDTAGAISLNAAQITNIVTGVGNIVADTRLLRVNGTQVATSTTDQGTGNYGNYPLFIGSRAGTSLPFNGHLYSLIVRGALSTDAQIAAAESYVNGKTGAY